MEADLIEVGVFKTKTEAKIAQGLLEVHGIKAFILGDDGSGNNLLPISNSYSVSLRVQRDDYLKARTVLERSRA